MAQNTLERKLIRVGYWFSEKKLKRLNLDEFQVICWEAGFDLQKMDLALPLDSQGPFDIILHKVTDLMAKSELGDVSAKDKLSCLQDFLRRNPQTCVLDPLDSIYITIDRHVQYQALRYCVENDQYGSFDIPTFVEFNSKNIEENKCLMSEHGVQYPFVSKPSVANGTSFCHKMQLVFNEAGLKDVKPPCVAQTFINHDAVLYKIFVIGEFNFIVERPSLKNFAAGPHDTIFFNSHNVSKPDSACELNENGACSPKSFMRPDRERLEKIAGHLRTHLQLSLFGADVIVDNLTAQYYIIDVNNFPSYDEVGDIHPYLLQLLKNTQKRRNTQQSTAVCASSLLTTSCTVEFPTKLRSGSDQPCFCQGQSKPTAAVDHILPTEINKIPTELDCVIRNGCLCGERNCIADFKLPLPSRVRNRSELERFECRNNGYNVVCYTSQDEYLSKEERILNSLNSAHSQENIQTKDAILESEKSMTL